MQRAHLVRSLAGVSWIASFALGVAALVLAAVNKLPSAWSATLASVVLIVFASVGALIAARRPANPIGWLFCSGALITVAGLVAEQSARYGLITRPGSLSEGTILAWAGRWLISLGIGLIINFLLLLFPDGRLPSPGWRWLGWVAAGTIALTTAVYMFLPGSLARGRTDFADFANVDNPFGVASADGTLEVLASIGVPVLSSAVTLACLAALIVRVRRAREEERQQLKWIAFAVAFLVLVLAVILVLFWSGSSAGGELWYVGIAGIPVATGIAILNYRLYDIDLLINRALVYAGLTACVVAVYVLAVGYLSALFPNGGNSAISLVATGVVAILFQPLRERFQRGINRLLYGQRDEPYAVLSKLGQRLEATLAPEAVLPTIVQSVREALKLPYTAIALRQADRLVIAAEVGAPVAEPLRLPLMYQSEPIGELLLGSRAAGEAFSAADRRLLDDLARQAGVAVHAVRLTADLQHSRQRLVTAREEERRRLRRDLHDGLGPELASMTLQAEAARDSLAVDPTRADALLADLTAQLQAATAEIRRLVYELRPPALDDLGLVAALRTLVARYDQGGPHGLRITVEAPERLVSLPAAVEVAAYRIGQEALTNVVRHAGARHCMLRLALADVPGRGAALSVEIRDDGSGLAAPRRAGVGLASMRERAAELGGTCRIEPVPTGGTCVLATLPLPTPAQAPVATERSSELTVGSGSAA